MKKSMYFSLAVASLFLGTLVFNACQKETKESLTSRSEEAGKKKPQANTKTCVHPTFRDKVVDTYCREGHSCGIGSFPSTDRNRIQWRVGTQCGESEIYPSWTSYYTLYKRTTSTAPYQYSQVTTFNCTNSSMWYAKTVLSNSSTFVLIVSEESTALPATIQESASGGLLNTAGIPLETVNSYSDYWKFTTGSTAGTTSCVGSEPGPIHL